MSTIKNITHSTLLIILLSVFTFSACSNQKEAGEDKPKKEIKSDEVTLTEKQVKEINIQTEKAELKPFSGYYKIPAKVVANQDKEAQVGSLVPGRVYKVFVKMGDYVKAGQILMQVDGLEIGEIKASYISAKSNLDFRKANYERQKLLLDQKAGSQKSLLEAQTEYEKAKAEFSAVDKKIHSVGLNDEEIINPKGNSSDEHTAGTLPVKSPIDGIVAERNVVIGQPVDASTNAFRIINTSSVWIDGQVLEKDLNRITPNSNVIFSPSSAPEQEFSGKVTYIGQVIDERTRTITIRAEFINKNNQLKSQMFGELKFPASQNSRSLLVPLESVVKIEDQDFVFIQKDYLSFERRPVQTGIRDNQYIQIIEGIKEGETVVTKGSFFLKSEVLKSELAEEE